MLLAGFASALAGLFYAEFASTVPIAGSAYTYGYATLGEFVAWIIGWDLILEYALGAATVAVGWSGHLTSFLHDFVGVDFPAQFAAAPGNIVQTAAGPVTAVFNLPAVIITILVTILIVIGVKESANVNTGIVIVKVGVVLVVCTILYVAVSLVMVGLVPYQAMKGSPAPMVVAIRAAEAASGGSSLLHAMTMLVELGAIAGLSSVMVVMMMAQPRIFYSMAKDGLLPPFAKKIHPKFRTPHITSMITGVVVSIASGFTPIGILGEMVSIGTLMAFVIVSIGIIFLRYQRPELVRPFKVPLVPFVPALSALVSLGLMAGLPGATWIRLVVWMVIGIVLYFAYGYTHSEVRHRDEALAATGGTRRR